MLIKLASFAATATLVIASIMPPAYALGPWITLNGISLQGISQNGLSVNGAAIATTGFAIDGIELPTAQR